MEEAKDKPRRMMGMRSAAELAARVARPIIGRHGFAEADLIARWPSIIGPRLAGFCCPLRLVRSGPEGGPGNLHIKVENGSLAMELQHLLPQLIERVNAHFGYRAVERITLSQGPLPRKPGRKKAEAAPGPPPDEARIAGLTGQVEDEELRAALVRLGRRVLKKEPGAS